MQAYKANIRPLSAFGTRLLGDTLFGQLCWTIRNRLGNERLVELLAGYTEGRPYAVVSDAFPSSYFPRPMLPGHWFAPIEGGDRKALKKQVWLPAGRLAEPVTEWVRHCVPASALAGSTSELPQPHNAIDRRTGTTGEGFAPYTMTRHWYRDTALLDVYVVLDESRLSADELSAVLTDMGELGFGRDAGIGLGRFKLNALEHIELPTQHDADAWLTLAPSAPHGEVWKAERCFYSVFTRFGRHGDISVRLGSPFKTPVLLAAGGAVLTPLQFEKKMFIGRGLGGDGSLSKSLPQTVHQGYSPVIGIRLPEIREAA